MDAFEFRLPDIGEGVAEGEVVEWHVRPGDTVDEDDPMVEVMTDKATVTICAPKSGRIRELRAQVGETAAVGTVLVVIDTAGGTPPREEPTAQDDVQAAPASGAGDRQPVATAVGDIRDVLPGSRYFSGAGSSAGDPVAAEPAAAPVAAQHFADKPLATPAVRRLARELEVDLRHVPPSGQSGRVTRQDVVAFAEDGGLAHTVSGVLDSPAKDSAGGAQAGSAPRGYAEDSETDHAVSVPPPQPTSTRGQMVRQREGLEVREPFVGVRRRIADRMQTAVREAAHFTFVEECDVHNLMELRQRLKPQAEARGVQLTYLPFVVKAVVQSLRKHRVLNSTLDTENNELVYRGDYHIGIATATDRGLVVPVVRHADQLSLLDLGAEIHRLSEAARSDAIQPAELKGSTFTVTSLGKLGGLFATPVLNYPEVGILGVHRMKERPVVRQGEVVVGQVMLLSLSFDHRIVDGHVGAAFAYDVIRYLEEPDHLFLEI